MRYSFPGGSPGHGGHSRLLPVIERVAPIAGFLKMVRQELRITLDRIGAKLTQSKGDLAVQLSPLVAEKCADGRVLDQCMFELIAFAVGMSSRVDKLSVDQVVHCPFDRGSVSLARRDQKIDIEHSTQKCRHLDDLPDRRQTIQTGVKRGLQGRRNLDGRAEADVTPQFGDRFC